MPRWVSAALIVTALLVSLGVVGIAAGAATTFDGLVSSSGLQLVLALTGSSLGALLVRRLPGHPIGNVLVGIGLAGAIPVAAGGWVDHPAAAWVWGWSSLLAISMLPLPFLLFPDGTLPGPRWRPFVGAPAVAVLAVGMIAAATIPVPYFLTTPASLTELSLSEMSRVLLRIGLLLLIGTTAAVSVAGVASLVVRFRRQATTETRAQIKVLAVGGGVALMGLVAAGVASIPGSLLLAPAALPLAMTVAILRHRWGNLDLYINRSMVYAILTAMVVGTFAALVGLAQLVVDAVAGTEEVTATTEFLQTAVPAAIIALLFQPARERVQRGVDHMLYGSRDEPYTVVAMLGRQLQDVGEPEAVLPRVVETITEVLQVPYAEVQLRSGDGFTTAAQAGRLVAPPDSFEMHYQGRLVGRLLVAPRSPTTPFRSAEQRLLGDLARQAGIAAHAVALTNDLRRSRERVVRTREEERRRLRRDLHDGLGPTLAGTILQLGAAESLLRTQPQALEELLPTVAQELQGCVDEVRRLVDDLRPPALDQLGLVEAIRRRADRLAASGLRISVIAEGDLGHLPAAVEVAAYRIVSEAVTNVVRHADAQHCEAALRLDGALTVEVADDGRGVATATGRVGVGLEAMQERADELGGWCAVSPRDGGGTLLTAHLPLTLA